MAVRFAAAFHLVLRSRLVLPCSSCTALVFLECHKLEKAMGRGGGRRGVREVTISTTIASGRAVGQGGGAWRCAEIGRSATAAVPHALNTAADTMYTSYMLVSLQISGVRLFGVGLGGR